MEILERYNELFSLLQEKIDAHDELQNVLKYFDWSKIEKKLDNRCEYGLIRIDIALDIFKEEFEKTIISIVRKNHE